ncbi:MAG: hypothetical protein MJ206_02255 [Bacilli bacterium]|nr:hypothetical protein [Bacilli bacterium]
MIKQVITITELSSLTGKSRPTLYKYWMNYSNNDKANIPYSIIQLFDLVNKENASKKEIVNFCTKNFSKVNGDMEIQEIVNLLADNKDKIDLKAIKKAIKEVIKNG